MKKLILSLLVFSSAAYAQVSKLPASDSLEKLTQHFNIEWTDGNITTGTTRMQAGVWKVALAGVTKAQTEMLVQEVKERSESKGKLTQLQATSNAFTAKDVTTLAKAFGEGNDFSPKNREGFALPMGHAYALLAKLSTNQNKDIVTTKVSAVYTEDGETRNVYLISFTSTVTRKTVLFFIIQGTM